MDPNYRALFDAVPGLYLLLDRAFTILAVNDASCRGTETGRIVGQPLFEVFPGNPDGPADGVHKLRARIEADRLYLASIVESSNDAIVSMDLDGIVTSWNRAAERMFGYNAGEIIGRQNTVLIPPDRLDDEKQVAGRIRNGEIVAHYETVRLRKDGTTMQVSLTASPIRDRNGAVIGASRIVQDISERKETEERLKSLQDELIHLSRWNTMGMMASTIAHELNQPLTAMVNYVRAARRTLDDADPRTAHIGALLDKAVDETKLAGGIIRSLREFIDKRESSRNPENLNTVVEEAVALSLAASAGSETRLRVTLDPLLPPVFIDKIQIEQVLLNLIRNAVEAMHGVGAGGELVLATGHDDRGFAAVSVRDCGPGIAPDILEKLFQPFVTTKEKGMGIGLTICQSIVEAHGGSIWTEPNDGPGVTFRFRLPVTAEACRAN